MPDNEPKTVIEESGVHKEWYKRAGGVRTPEELLCFVSEMRDMYKHDYGTIVHSMAAAMVAAMSCLKAGPQGGITGFQAGALQWELVRQLGMTNLDHGAKVLSYADVLYPQYTQKFVQHIMDQDWHTGIKESAGKLLSQNEQAHPDVRTHWQKIAGGWLPDGFVVESGDNSDE